MGNAKQTEVSKKNQYWIPRNRYYELKYFCLQFCEWQKRRAVLDGLVTHEQRSPTEKEAIEREELSSRISMVLEALRRTAGIDYPELEDDLFIGITKGVSYDTMAAKKVMPVSRNTYYDVYRKFFWVLDIMRR